jgi:hypothetical protein
MEPDEADFDQLIAWLELQARADKKDRETAKREPRPSNQTAQIILFPMHRVRT